MFAKIQVATNSRALCLSIQSVERECFLSASLTNPKKAIIPTPTFLQNAIAACPLPSFFGGEIIKVPKGASNVDAGIRVESLARVNTDVVLIKGS